MILLFLQWPGLVTEINLTPNKSFVWSQIYLYLYGNFVKHRGTKYFSPGHLLDCPERSSACRDWNKKVWPHYCSAASTPLASSTAANHLQVGDDHLQMPSRSGAVLYLADVCIPVSSVVGTRQVAAAVGRQRDTHSSSTYKDYDRSARLLCWARRHGTDSSSNCGL